MSSTPKFSSSAVAAETVQDAHVSHYADDVALPAWLVNSCVFGVLIVDQSADVVFANTALAEALGFQAAEDLIGQNLRSSLLVDDADWESWERGGEQSFRLRDATGATVSFHGEGGRRPDDAEQCLRYAVVSLQRSPNETGRLLEHAARMEAVAGLSSGIAHDFNNLLTVLVGNLYLLGEELRGNESAFARIKAARDTALRGAELTRQLLNYARDDDGDDIEIRPASVVHKLQPLLEKLVGSTIELAVDLSAESYTVNASRAQLESAIVNLVINARDAIDGSGCIRVAVNEQEEGEYDNRLVVSVTDDGPGMPPEVQDRVFEPFFTTKGEGRGTGLGLSMVRWFAESLSGSVAIESAPGTGTTVSIVLPLQSSENGDTTCSRTIPLSVLPSGDERIALLIDDAEVRAMTQQTLTVLGYDVERVESVETARDDGDTVGFDLAVVDADNSQELIALVDELRRGSSVRVLALTARNIVELDDRHQLRKPFSLVELASGVRGVLDGESASG